MEELTDYITIGELLGRAAKVWPERPALEYGQAVWTYSRLDRETDLLAGGFLAAGISRGEHVAIWADNHPNTMLSCYGLLKIGAVPVFLGGCSTWEELAARIADGGCIHLMYAGQVRGIPAEDVIPKEGVAGIVGTCFIGEGSYPADCTLDELLTDGAALPHGQIQRAKEAVQPGDGDILLFTSGSSGVPKGVLLSHFARVSNGRMLAHALRVTEEDRFCCALPLFHCFAFTANAICALTAGACLCFPEDGHTAVLLRTIQEKGCTIFMGVPTMFSSIVARRDLDSYDLSSLRTGLMAGSSYPPTLFEQARQRMGYQLLPAYGLTEATGGVTCGDFGDSPWLLSHSVGKPLPHTEVRIWDQNRLAPACAGEPGEVWIRGRCIMEDYYPSGGRKPAGGPDDDGWFATGDIGQLDEDGNLYIVGRLKELIIRGGENISPVEVEDAILSDGRVIEVKVVGVPDPHYMEEICACVIASEPVSEEEIRRLARIHVGPRKIPKYVLFFSSFPRTVTGKINAEAVRAAAMEVLGLAALP